MADEKTRQAQLKILRLENAPVIKISRADFDKLPKAMEMKGIKPHFLDTCPIGTMFICTKSHRAPDIDVVKKVVLKDGERDFVPHLVEFV